MEVTNADRGRFFFKNLVRGIIFLFVIVGGYLLASRYLGFDLKESMGSLYESPRAIFGIFWISEIVFGIIPPEFFMIWSQRHGDIDIYISNVFLLMCISYFAGIVGYWFGAYLYTTRAYTFFKKRVFGKFEDKFEDYGGFLVIVAAMTPIPFSGICMLVGSFRYPFARFLVFAMARFIRFGLYAYIVWESQMV